MDFGPSLGRRSCNSRKRSSTPCPNDCAASTSLSVTTFTSLAVPFFLPFTVPTSLVLERVARILFLHSEPPFRVSCGGPFARCRRSLCLPKSLVQYFRSPAYDQRNGGQGDSACPLPHNCTTRLISLSLLVDHRSCPPTRARRRFEVPAVTHPEKLATRRASEPRRLRLLLSHASPPFSRTSRTIAAPAAVRTNPLPSQGWQCSNFLVR